MSILSLSVSSPLIKLRSARFNPFKCGYLSEQIFVGIGEQILGKQTAELSTSPLFPCKLSCTTSHLFLLHRSLPNVFNFNVSVLFDCYPSFSFKLLVIYVRWLPLSIRTRTGTVVDFSLEKENVVAICRGTLGELAFIAVVV